MKTLCMICSGSVEIEESQYPEHMATVHGGKSQVEAVKEKAILPVGVDPSMLPTPEFLEVAQQIDNPPPPKPQESPNPKAPVAEKKPLELTYKYVGQCENGHPITTLETDVDGKHFVIAYCLGESKQIESREVANLKPQVKPVGSPSSELPVAEVKPKKPKVEPVVEEAKNEQPNI